MEQQILREVLTIRNRNVTEADREIGNKFNELAMMALKRAEHYLRYGPESSRLAVTKQILAAAAKLGNVNSEEQLMEHRQAFMRYLSSQTQNVTEHLPDADAKAIIAGTKDQDDEP